MNEIEKTIQSGWTEFPCDLCESKEAVEVPRTRDYTGGQVLSICKKCGLIYAGHRRSIEKVAETWSKELYGDPSVLSAASYSARNPHVKARQTYVADFIDSHVGLQGKSLVDIGAGEGQFLEIARKYGCKTFGIEPSAKNCEQLQKNDFPCFNGTAEDYLADLKKQVVPSKADVVTIMWTLECSQSPLNLLNTAYEMLKEGGHVTVATGSRILVPFKKPLHTFLSTNLLDTHPVHFSFNTLGGLLARAGFEVSHFNPYIENDILLLMAKKMPKSHTFKWAGDDYLKVEDYFERWHQDSLLYR